MPEVNNPIEEVGALVLTLAGTGVQMKRGAGGAIGARQSVLTWNDVTGELVVSSGPEPGAAVWVVAAGGLVSSGVGIDGTAGNVQQWYALADSNYRHTLQAGVSATADPLANWLRFNLNGGVLGTALVPVLELRGGNAPGVYILPGAPAALLELGSTAGNARLRLNGVGGSGIEYLHSSGARWGVGRGWATGGDDFEFINYNVSGLGMVGAINYTSGVLVWTYNIQTGGGFFSIAGGLQQFSLTWDATLGALLQSYASKPLRINHQGNAVFIDGGSPLIVGTTDPGGGSIVRVAGNIYASGAVLTGAGTGGGVWTVGVSMLYMTALTGTAYTIINAPDGNNGILIGMGDASNYFNNNVHYFRNRATDVIFGWFTAPAVAGQTGLAVRVFDVGGMATVMTGAAGSGPGGVGRVLWVNV